MKRILLILLIIGAQQLRSQSLEIGIFGGGAYYIGDLNPHYHFLNTKEAYGGFVRYLDNKRWAHRANFTFGKIMGDDLTSGFMPERKLSFKSNIYELSYIVEFNFLPYFTGSTRDVFTPYLFSGLSGFYHKPIAFGISLRDEQTENQGGTILTNAAESYSLYQFAIPFGMGLKYSFSGKFAASFEWGLRKTFTDYLDDVSTEYYISSSTTGPNDYNYSKLRISDPTQNHEPFMQRGLKASKDWYSFFGLSLFYRFNLTKRGACATFQSPY